MFPKFDIYDTEWLDLVFKGRNKSYGAYDLRKHYNRNMVRAMIITAVVLGGIFLATAIQSKPPVMSPVAEKDPTIVVDMGKEITVERASTQQSATRHKHNGLRQAAAPEQTTHAPLNNKPASTPTPPEPPKTDNGRIVPVIQPAKPDERAIVDEPDAMPQPNGGKAGLTEFLDKNLQYPADAAAKNISGRVWLSFVVEKDGRLTDIEVTHSAGYGFDEEAVRVLKLAPFWQPGVQNGQPVRVRYTIPVNFRIVK